MEKKQQKFQTKDLATISLLAALAVVLTRFLAIETQFLRLSFTFIPTVLAAIMYGPWTAAGAGAMADFIGFFLFPKGYPYSPGFTISAAVGPALYGLFLYRKPLTIKRIALASTTVMLLVNVGLNSLWLRILYDQAFWGMLPIRIGENLVSLPIKAGIIYWVTGNKAIQRILKDYPIKWVH